VSPDPSACDQSGARLPTTLPKQTSSCDSLPKAEDRAPTSQHSGERKQSVVPFLLRKGRERTLAETVDSSPQALHGEAATGSGKSPICKQGLRFCDLHRPKIGRHDRVRALVCGKPQLNAPYTDLASIVLCGERVYSLRAKDFRECCCRIRRGGAVALETSVTGDRRTPDSRRESRRRAAPFFGSQPGPLSPARPGGETRAQPQSSAQEHRSGSREVHEW